MSRNLLAATFLALLLAACGAEPAERVAEGTRSRPPITYSIERVSPEEFKRLYPHADMTPLPEPASRPGRSPRRDRSLSRSCQDDTPRIRCRPVPGDLEIRRPDLEGVRRLGTVRWWKDERGYGRITADDGEILWAHFSSLEMDGYRTLRHGQRVSFVWKGGIQDHGRHRAEDVQPLG